MNGLYAYFAYGSNLLPGRMLRRCPAAVPYGSAVLENYRLTERLYADVDYAPGAQVYGFIYLLRASDILLLDRFEGYPKAYKRYMVDVMLDDGSEIQALVYEMTEATKASRNGMSYPEEYRIMCRDGAKIHQIPNHFTTKRRKCQ